MRTAPTGRRILQLLAPLVLAAMVPLDGVSAQSAYPEVEVRQILGTGVGTWSNSARVSIDRDAFVVVFELGADGRARIIYPESPRATGFMRASRKWYVPLPSVDAMFIQATTMRTPTVVAFASDLAPDLSSFTDDGRDWDYMFAIKDGVSRETTLRDLATLIFGDPEMPYSVSESRIAPTLPPSAQAALRTCGYQASAYGSSSYYDFLWSMFGPFYGWGYGLNAQYYDSPTITSWATHNFSNFLGFGFSNVAFTRFATSDLWNLYGVTCDPLSRLYARQLVLLTNNRPPAPPLIGAAPPADVPERDPHGKVGDVGILVPTDGVGAEQRAASVKLAAAELEATSSSLTRQANEDMVQRQEIASLLAQLRLLQRLGGDNTDIRDWRRLLANATQAENGSSSGTRLGSGFNKPARRASTASASGASSSGGSSSSGGGSSSAGSSAGSQGSAGSAGRATETRGGTGRGGTGRPPYQQ